MNWENTPQRYGFMAVGLHWFMFLLLVVVYSCIELRELFPKGSEPRDLLKTWHFMLGLLVFALVWLRLAVRLSGSVPLAGQESDWQTILAKFVHFALYMLMILMPLLGWLMLSAAGKPIPFFGLTLPSLISEDKNIAQFLKETHETLGTIGYFLIAAHALAALYHHFIKKDGTLFRMLNH
jgi:cytochrome b561